MADKMAAKQNKTRTGTAITFRLREEHLVLLDNYRASVRIDAWTEDMSRAQAARVLVLRGLTAAANGKTTSVATAAGQRPSIPVPGVKQPWD